MWVVRAGEVVMLRGARIEVMRGFIGGGEHFVGDGGWWACFGVCGHEGSRVLEYVR